MLSPLNCFQLWNVAKAAAYLPARKISDGDTFFTLLFSTSFVKIRNIYEPVWALWSEEAFSLSWVAKGGAVPESNNENTKWVFNFSSHFVTFHCFFSLTCVSSNNENTKWVLTCLHILSFFHWWFSHLWIQEPVSIALLVPVG